MKHVILAAAILTTPCAALADDLSGSWKVDTRARGVALALDCHFLQQEKVLGGTCGLVGVDDAPGPLTGIIEGQNARWTYPLTVDGEPMQAAFNGNVEGTTITGQMELGGVRAPFAALKQ